ncbi:MAG TPA: hypothetical protein V6D19_06280 [Stenomitos sp.]
MTIVQLQLDLWQQLQQAQATPQMTDWSQLCLAFDEAIAHTPVSLQLAIAADAIEQMAIVLEARAIMLVQQWQRQPSDGPVLDEDLFSEFVRRSFHLDLSELVAVPELYVRSVSEKSQEEVESTVEYREKADVLAELESLMELNAADEVESLAYDEDVMAWAKAVRSWLTRQGVESAAIAQIQKGTGLSVVKLWLAGLLGGFELVQTGEFYEGVALAINLR